MRGFPARRIAVGKCGGDKANAADGQGRDARPPSRSSRWWPHHGPEPTPRDLRARSAAGATHTAAREYADLARPTLRMRAAEHVDARRRGHTLRGAVERPAAPATAREMAPAVAARATRRTSTSHACRTRWRRLGSADHLRADRQERARPKLVGPVDRRERLPRTPHLVTDVAARRPARPCA